MTSAADHSAPSEKELAELSALADGTLDPSRQEEVRARIAASPELTALYERERRTVEVLHRVRETDRAPLALKQRIEAQRPSRATRTRRRTTYGAALAAGLAVIALALVLVLPGGTPGAPSVSEAAALALRGASMPAPMPDHAVPGTKLGQNVGDVYFPDWAGKFGWTAIGQRVDHIRGRQAVTVYYKRNDEIVAYTIVRAPALDSPSAPELTLNNTQLRTLHLGSRQVVTWRRDNQTCVLSSGPSVPVPVLQKLAAWSGGGDPS